MDDAEAFEEVAPTSVVREERARELHRDALTLRWRDGAGEHRVRLEGALTVGSAPHASVRVHAPTVSRLHARIEVSQRGTWIVDLDSTNGTRVNGVRVGTARLEPGSEIRLGDAVLAVEARTERAEVALWPEDRFGALLGRSTAMRALFARLSRIAASDGTVLVQGETGTGKELVARAIHDASPRAGGPFVVVDCGAIPESLFESELFGHARGAFTGADRAREGAVDAAEGGTLFLDEVGELPVSLQPKLLRMLESRTIRRVGESTHRPVDVRVVAATHRDLARMVAAGAFREDLYFRLAVLPVEIPPLRERMEDAPLLARHLAGGRPLDAATLAEIRARPWLGNVRELRNFVERSVTLGAAEALRSMPAVRARPGDGGDAQARAVDAALAEVPVDAPYREVRERLLDQLERRFLEAHLERTHWNVSAVAEAMGMNRTHVHRLLKKHGLSR